MQKQYENDIWENSNNSHSLSIRDTDHISIFLRFYVFYHNINVKGNVRLFQSANNYN